MPSTSSLYSPNGNLQTTVQPTPQQLNTGYDALAKYVSAYKPKAAVQAQALAPQQAQQAARPLTHTEGPRGRSASEMQQPTDEWVDVPAMNRLGFSVGSATTRVKKNSNAAQMTPVGVVGY